MCAECDEIQETLDKVKDALCPAVLGYDLTFYRQVAERDALREALQRCIKALQVWRAHLEVNDPTLETPEVIEAIKQARAALGAAEEAA